MKQHGKLLISLVITIAGCALFGLGFNLFLIPHDMNVGGLTGLSMIIGRIISYDGIGLISAVINLPLFFLGGWKVGKKFFFGSLLGMVLLSVSIDAFALLPRPETEPLIGALYGGVLCGVGGGAVFSCGYSTGGSDIIVRLLKLKWSHVPIGVITTVFDLFVVVLTAIIFDNMTLALYSGVSIFVSGRIVDVVVYRFDYSKVALIISKHYDAVATAINKDLERGVTLLDGEGAYHHVETKVVLTAVKRQDLADLKEIVVNIDPDAFIIVQEAHQVLGEGFAKYSKDAL